MAIREASLAAPAVAWFERTALEAYHEVSIAPDLRAHYPDIGNARVDLALKSDVEFSVCELKRELAIPLFLQASRWLPYANRVWLAVPPARDLELRDEAARIAQDFYGFGVLEVHEKRVVVIRTPRWNASPDEALRHSLREEQKTFAEAGSQGGRHFTSEHATHLALAAYILDHDGSTLDEALDVIKHHYRDKKTAAKDLKKLISKGKIQGAHFGWKHHLHSTAELARRGGVG